MRAVVCQLMASLNGRVDDPVAFVTGVAPDQYEDIDAAYATIEADMAFHWAVCSPCRHEMLLDQLKGLQTQTRQFIFYTKFYSSDAEGEVEAHLPILMAVRNTAPERAESAMRDHIISAGERLLVSMLEQATTADAGETAEPNGASK